MLYDETAEKCRQCALKHLSTAVVSLGADDLPDILKKVYFCGNLAHAANHFVKLDERLAEEIRELRIDAQDDSLNFILAVADIRDRLLAIIEKITKFTPPEAPVVTSRKVIATASNIQPVQKRGCPCHGRR